MKEKLIVLKKHIFVKQIQNEAYNYYQKDGLMFDDLLPHVASADNYRNDQ